MERDPQQHHAKQIALDEFAQRLAQLRPVPLEVNRDQLMFAAGRASLLNDGPGSGPGKAPCPPEFARHHQRRWLMSLWTIMTTTALVVLSLSWWEAHTEVASLRNDLEQALAPRGSGEGTEPQLSTSLPQPMVVERPPERPNSRMDSASHDLTTNSDRGKQESWLGRISWLAINFGGSDDSAIVSGPNRSLLGLRNELIDRSWQRTWPVSTYSLTNSPPVHSSVPSAEPATAGQRLRKLSPDSQEFWFDEEGTL